MKKFLLTLVVFASIGVFAKLQAQSCTLSNFTIDQNSTTQVGGNCLINVDISFDLAHNNGFKHMWIHLWPTSIYPTLPYSGRPTAAELANTAGNIGLDITNGSGSTPSTVTLQTSYPGGGVTVTGATVSLSAGTGAGGSDRVTITGVVLMVAGSCGSSASITGDAWGTNSASQNSVQCLNQGSINFVANDPTITGFKVCSTPRTLNIGIQTLSSSNISVSYTLYKDDGDAIFEPGTQDISVGSAGPFTINSGSPYSASGVTYTGNNVPGENSSIWVAVTSSNSAGTQISLFQNQCAALPVGLKSFTASRNRSNVGLTWVTTFEENNSGFELQRSLGSGGWEVVTFVATKAPNGNSTENLTYTYTDMNSFKGISQYRLRQIDIDGKSKYSEIRAVRGEGQVSKTLVYPNPSFDGKIKVVFEDVNGSRDVSLIDMNGKMVKQWNGVTANNLQFDITTPGFYNLRVINRETGEQTIEKIVVNKR
jgi:hypothetical protein